MVVLTPPWSDRQLTGVCFLSPPVDAAPLPLFQVPAYCGYSVRVTWEDLVLMAPYDGCYITQEVPSILSWTIIPLY